MPLKKVTTNNRLIGMVADFQKSRWLSDQTDEASAQDLQSDVKKFRPGNLRSRAPSLARCENLLIDLSRPDIPS